MSKEGLKSFFEKLGNKNKGFGVADLQPESVDYGKRPYGLASVAVGAELLASKPQRYVIPMDVLRQCVKEAGLKIRNNGRWYIAIDEKGEKTCEPLHMSTRSGLRVEWRTDCFSGGEIKQGVSFSPYLEVSGTERDGAIVKGLERVLGLHGLVGKSVTLSEPVVKMPTGKLADWRYEPDWGEAYCSPTGRHYFASEAKVEVPKRIAELERIIEVAKSSVPDSVVEVPTASWIDLNQYAGDAGSVPFLYPVSLKASEVQETLEKEVGMLREFLESLGK